MNIIKFSMFKDAILWGASGQATVLWECLTLLGLKVVAIFDNNENLVSPIPEIPFYPGKEFGYWLKQRDPAHLTGFSVAIGGDKGRDRIQIHHFLESNGLYPLTVLHPNSYISNSAKIESGAQILVHATIGVNTFIGKETIVNTGAIIDHDCKLGKGVHICPGATLAGCVEVEDYATIFTGAIILPRVNIGIGATVGAGAVVIKDVPPHTVVVGNPSRIIREPFQ
jgi:sugar O-acyltransferase (sialic acid O-acetyltransferase NeuD family)